MAGSILEHYITYTAIAQMAPLIQLRQQLR